MPDGQYCAEILSLRGCCGYGRTADEALFELEGVKERVLSVWTGKERTTYTEGELSSRLSFARRRSTTAPRNA